MNIINTHSNRRLKILFKYPTRSRPLVFKRVISKYNSMLSGLHDYIFVVSADSDDLTMNNSSMILFMQKNNIKYYFGDNKSKILAVNANMDGHEFDILYLISDDMIPQVKGFDAVIAKKMLLNFPMIDGALHINDGIQGRNLITLSIMGKKLYDLFGYIYHPDYKSLWCDNLFSDEVKRLNKCIFINLVIVKHEWKGAGLGNDELYKRNDALYERDKIVYNRRKSLGFPRQSVISLEFNPTSTVLKSSNSALLKKTRTLVVADRVKLLRRKITNNRTKFRS